MSSHILSLSMLAALVVTGCDCQQQAFVSVADTVVIEPSQVDFGVVPAGQKKEVTLQIRQQGALPAGILSMGVDPGFGNSKVFSITSMKAARIEKGQSTPATLAFLSNKPGKFSGRAWVWIQESTSPLPVLLTAEAVAPDALIPDTSDGGTKSSDGGMPDAGMVDGGSCTPKTCQQLEKNCGTVSDGCASSIVCGVCVAPESCGGGGTPNVCGGTGGGGTGGGSQCGASCSSWTQCSNPSEGCDTSRGCCVPCGGAGQPCCVNYSAGLFFCSAGNVCGRSIGSGTGVGYYCCKNQGDGCCTQGGCSGSTCCKCPRNGLNACVQASFGCGGC